jgi:hypothetical protein
VGCSLRRTTRKKAKVLLKRKVASVGDLLHCRLKNMLLGIGNDGILTDGLGESPDHVAREIELAAQPINEERGEFVSECYSVAEVRSDQLQHSLG